ncbi:hypothetical protein DCCM_3883 [Desulfocucumis palustris]|uniref:Uncharacterized protein n=1 Tax=Desulfocucumis palustris TaxID=1898651 RepID=A0A2L2XGB6_9FIRM|nr:hypothetical protein DCCM_3883 [Desulfocucumis palustris]
MRPYTFRPSFLVFGMPGYIPGNSYLKILLSIKIKPATFSVIWQLWL